MLQNAYLHTKVYLLANIDFDTAENEPAKILKKLQIWRENKYTILYTMLLMCAAPAHGAGRVANPVRHAASRERARGAERPEGVPQEAVLREQDLRALVLRSILFFFSRVDGAFFSGHDTVFVK